MACEGAASIRETALSFALEYYMAVSEGISIAPTDDDVVETARTFESYLKGMQH